MGDSPRVIRKTYGRRIFEIRLTEAGEIHSCYETEETSKVWTILNFFQLPLNIQIDIINELSRRPRN